jgi:hypothetical protein
MFDQTGRSPLIIPVVNVINGKPYAKTTQADKKPSVEIKAATDQKRFQEMRAKLLSQKA